PGIPDLARETLGAQAPGPWALAPGPLVMVLLPNPIVREVRYAEQGGECNERRNSEERSTNGRSRRASPGIPPPPAADAAPRSQREGCHAAACARTETARGRRRSSAQLRAGGRHRQISESGGEPEPVLLGARRRVDVLDPDQPGGRQLSGA